MDQYPSTNDRRLSLLVDLAHKTWNRRCVSFRLIWMIFYTHLVISEEADPSLEDTEVIFNRPDFFFLPPCWILVVTMAAGARKDCCAHFVAHLNRNGKVILLVC